MPTVDFDADGRQHGVLALARTDSPFERRDVPVSVLRRGEGPRVVIVASADPDPATPIDRNGPTGGTGALAVHRLARELDTQSLVGTVVLVPGLPPGALSALGREVFGHADAVLELAPAGAGLAFSPVAAIRADTDDTMRERAESMLIAFGAPDSARLAPAFASGALDGAFEASIPHVRATLDGVVAPADALDIALAGCRNVLISSGVLDAPFALRATRMLALREADAVVQSPSAGLFEPRVRAGLAVHRDYPVGLLVDPGQRGAAPVEILAPHDGIVIALRRDTRVVAGNTLAVLAEEMPR